MRIGAIAAAALAVLVLTVIVVLARRRVRALDEVARGVRALIEDRPIRPVRHGFRGATGRLAAVFNEVAPRLQDRLGRLEEDRQLLRAVLGGMAEGVVAVDSRKRLLFANEAAVRLLGVEAQAEGRLIAELIRSPKVLEAVTATLARAEPYQVEMTLSSPDRPSLVLVVYGRRLTGTPPAGAVLVFHDVTETRRLERVRQDFVANASHELKTPLAAIKAYTETLLDGALDDAAVNLRFLRGIDEQADRLNRLVQDLLSLARLESGDEPFQHTPLVLAPVVRNTVEAHRARAEASHLELSLEVAPEAETLVVRADEEAIRQVLDNLIDNALKYTAPGGRVGVRVRPWPPRRVLIEVVDTGIGIPRQELPRVFERFYRADKARSRELGGTGLGLSIVKHLVQSLGGSITVESRVGEGSTFTVSLPLTSSSADAAR